MILTDGGNIGVDGINGRPDCVTGFPLNDDIPFNVHPIVVVVVLSRCLFYLDVFNKMFSQFTISVVSLRIKSCFVFYINKCLFYKKSTINWVCRKL